MTKQIQIVEILKHKGIGPKGSKQLSTEDIELLPALLTSDQCSLITKSTLLTALLLLDRNEAEEVLVSKIKADLDHLPQPLRFLLLNKSNDSKEKQILDLIHRVDLSYEEAKTASNTFLDSETPEYLQAAFLEALRLKRETDDENKAFYQYCR